MRFVSKWPGATIYLSIGLSIPNIIRCFVKRSKCDILHANVDLQSVLNFLNTKAALFGRIQNGMICVTNGSGLRLDLPTSRPQNFLERKARAGNLYVFSVERSEGLKFLCFWPGKKRRALRKSKLRHHQHRNTSYLLCTIFVRKTACQKYFFQILSQKKKNREIVNLKIWSDKSTQSVDWFLWIHDSFLDLPKRRQNTSLDSEIKVWIFP